MAARLGCLAALLAKSFEAAHRQPHKPLPRMAVAFVTSQLKVWCGVRYGAGPLAVWVVGRALASALGQGAGPGGCRGGRAGGGAVCARIRIRIRMVVEDGWPVMYPCYTHLGASPRGGVTRDDKH